MNTRELQQKAVNGSEKSLSVNELWDWNAPKDQWKRVSLATIAKALGVEKLTAEHNDALTAAGGERVPNPFTINKVKVRGWNMPPLCDASKSSSIGLPADTAAVSDAEGVSDAAEGAEELSPKLANGELPQETVQDALESAESDVGLKPELVELETAEGLEAITEGATVSVIKWYDPIASAAKVEAWHERNRQLGAKPEWMDVNPKLVAATRDIEPLPIQERLDLWRATQRAHSAKAAQEVHIHAQVYAMEGLRVFRLARHSKVTLKGSNGYKDGTSDLNVINEWFGEAAYHSNFNIGIATGETDGEFDLVVVDIDKHVDKKTGELIDGFANCKLWLKETGLQLPDTLTVRTRSGGNHRYYWIPKGTAIKSNSHILKQYGDKNGVDVRCHGGYVVAPPSYVDDKEDNISGSYKHEVDFPIAHAPADLVAALLAMGAGGSKATKSASICLPSAHGELITGQDAEDVIYALRCIDTDRLGYNDWMEITALMHNVEGGFEAWEEWAKEGKDWGAEAAKKWEQTEGMELASSVDASKIFSQAAHERALGTYPKAKDYVNPSTRRVLERKQTNGSDELTNGGLGGVMPAVNPKLEAASAKALGALPSVEVLRDWCMVEGAKAEGKTDSYSKYQFLVSGVLAGDADVVAAHYDGKAFKWDTAVYAAAKQAAGYVLTKHHNDTSIKEWSDIDSDGQAKLLNLVEGVFKASPIAEACVNIAGLGSTEVLSKKVQQGVEDWKMSGGGNSKSPAVGLPSPPSVATFSLGARPAHLGGTAASGGGADYLSAAVGFVGGAAVVDEASAEDVADITALLKHKVKESEMHRQKCKAGNGADHDWQGAKVAALLAGDVEWMRDYVSKYPLRKDGKPVGWFTDNGDVDYGNAVYSACHELAKVALTQHIEDGDARKARYDAARKSLVGLIKVDGLQGVLMWSLLKRGDVGKATQWLYNEQVGKALSNRLKLLDTLHAAEQQRKTEERSKETALKARLAASDYHTKLMGQLRNLYAKPWNETEHLAGGVDFSLALADDAEFLHYSGGKYPRPLCTAQNVALLLGYYGCRVRVNTMRHMMEYEGFGVGDGDHEGALNLVWQLVQCNGLPWELSTVDRMLQTWANQHKFHPVKDWIGSAPWDGESRIEALADTITVADGQRDMWLIYLRRWLLGAVNALYSKDGGASKHMLVLQGKQSAGKTSWFRKLAGGHPVCKDGVMLDIKNKDSVRETLTWWLIELGELEATYQTRQIAELKAFVTKQSDEWRDPFARRQNVYPRRTAFVGTVNKDEPLADFTGNTRFATVTAEKINYLHDVDMQQVWAEVLSIWLYGTLEDKRHYLSRNEELRMEAQNERYVANGVAYDYVELAFDWSDKGKAEMQRAYERRDGTHFMPAAQVFQLLESMGYKVSGQAQKNEVANALTKLGAVKHKGTGGVRGYYLPAPKRQTMQ